MEIDGRAVLIVGAGPTGLTAALEFARRGIRPRIIDREAGPTPLSKAVGISPHSLDLLEASGATPKLLADGIKIRHVRVHYQERELGVIDFASLPHHFRFLLSLPQSETESIMAHALAGMGVAVEWRTELTALRQDADTVEVSLAGPDGGRDERFDCVFGADGVHSAVRRALGLTFEGHTHRRQWSIADAEIADWSYEADEAHLFLHPRGDVGFVIPIDAGRFRAIANTGDALSRVPGSHRIVRVLRSEAFQVPVRQAHRYQSGRVFLGGDAAHVHSPVGARGMNLGIEDATAFVRRFVDGELAGYTAERQPVGRRWIALSERILSLAQAEGPIVVAFRNLLFRIIAHLPVLQRPMLERVAGLKE